MEGELAQARSGDLVEGALGQHDFRAAARDFRRRRGAAREHDSQQYEHYCFHHARTIEDNEIAHNVQASRELEAAMKITRAAAAAAILVCASALAAQKAEPTPRRLMISVA